MPKLKSAPTTIKLARHPDVVFRETLDKFRRKSAELQKADVGLRYEFGGFINELGGESSRYGSHTVAEAAEEMEMAETLVNDCARVNKVFSRGLVDEMAASGLVWSDIVVLSSLKDQSQYARLVRARSSRRLTFEQLKEEVKKINEKERNSTKILDRRGGIPIGVAIRACARELERTKKKVEEFGNASTELRRMVDTDIRKPELIAELRETEKGLLSTLDRMLVVLLAVDRVRGLEFISRWFSQTTSVQAAG